MKILIINGSPRGEGSNTMKVTNAFIQGAGWTDVDTIDISKIKVGGCLGCFTCWSKTPGKCVIKDDMADSLEKILDADIIISSFPLYSCFFPGPMKTFIDRQLPLALPYMDKNAESGGHPSRYDMSKKRNIYISTCGFWTAKGNYGVIEALLERAGSSEKVETLFCGQGELFNVEDADEVTKPYLVHVSQAGKDYVQNGKISDKTRELLNVPLLEREVFENLADGSWGDEAQ